MSWRPESPPSSQSMYRGLYKSRSVKPKGTYKRSKSNRGTRLPRAQEFASQLQGAMRLKPNHKAQHKFTFEGFVPTKPSKIVGGATPVNGEFLSFTLGDLPNSGEIVSMFQRYKIKGCTLMVYLATAPTNATTPVSVIVAPYKCNTTAALNSNSIQMVQGAQWKPLLSSQDLLRCRILNPVPFVAASVGSTAPAAVFAGKGTIFCTATGSQLSHAGFLIAVESTLPAGAELAYKLNIQYECYDFKVSPTLANIKKPDLISIKPKTLDQLCIESGESVESDVND